MELLASLCQFFRHRDCVAALTLPLALAGVLLATPAAGQSCGGTPCTITAPSGGTWLTGATIPAFSVNGALTLSLTNQAPFSVSYADGTTVVLQAYASYESSPATNANVAGTATGTMSVTNTAPLNLGASVSIPSVYVAGGILVTSHGGSGAMADTSPSVGGNGGAAGAVTVTNTTGNGSSGTILLQPAAFGGAIGIGAAAQGGAGGTFSPSGTDSGTLLPSYPSTSSNGGNGGAAGAVSLTNTAALTIGPGNNVPTNGFYIATPSSGASIYYAFDYVGFRGLSATSVGGPAGSGAGASGAACTSDGTGCGGGATGGSGGNATIVNSGPVVINWNWVSASGPNTAALPTNVAFGAIAASVGSPGLQTVTTNYSGGAGGAASQASVTLNQGGNVSVAVGTTGPLISGTKIPPLAGAGVAAFSLGGMGGQPYGASHDIGANPVIAGGTGGSASEAIVSINGANVSTRGNQMAGAVSVSHGGDGGSGNWNSTISPAQGGSDSNGGSGGAGGIANVGIDAGNMSTSGQGAPGALVVTLGGTGGVGATYYGNAIGDAGNGGPGGAGGSVEASWYQGVVTTNGANAPSLFAGSFGGDGGKGGDRPNGGSGDSGGGGGGGSAGAVTVQFQQTRTTTNGANSPGIVAVSVGGLGGSGGTANANSASSPRAGGAGGASGTVTVTLDAASSIITSGATSSAVIAASVAGAGGTGNNSSNIGSSQGGPGGAGGSAAVNATAVAVSNAGLLQTSGASSMGILAQGMTGGGGAGGSAGGIIASGGTGASAGSIGLVSVKNAGNVTTAGTTSHGIIAQSIAGGGGNGGSLDFANSGIGGGSGLAASGGAVNVINAGTIQTSGSGSLGLLAQSIGGGGGNGGNAAGLFSIGGYGAGGGDGSVVTVSQIAGSILTSGTQAHGLVAQSTGGGGGNGGSATSVSVGATMAIGGSAGGGGWGNDVTVKTTGGSIVAQGTKSIGIAAQSVGGGGGTGGAAYSAVVGALFSAGVSVGGSGGAGGIPGSVTVDLADTSVATGQAPALVNGTYGTTIPATNQLPVDAFGIVAQAVAGGGGIGGSASANAVAVAIPIPDTGGNYGFALSAAVGGSGGTASSVPQSAPVNVTLRGGTSVLTYGQGGHGVMAQSIGGGGGEGGDSSAYAATVAYGRAATLDDSEQFGASIAAGVGGKSSAGGSGGAVTVTLGDTSTRTSTITTFGDFADGILAQSIGGGGGNGGTGAASSYYAGGDTTVTAAVAVGSKGSAGGNGGLVTVTVTSQGGIQTYGDGANAIVAQSVGGSGGTSQGSTVNVTGAYLVETENQPKIESVQPSASVTLNIGSTGAGGGNGFTVVVANAGTIATQGGDASGIVAQSIGGGGGLGGAAGGQASADNPISTVTKVRTFVSNVIAQNVPAFASLTASLGSSTGGNGGNGGLVQVTHSGKISTQGDWASGIFAQSVGGGGGRGGTAVGVGGGPAQVSLSLGSVMGGQGGGTGIMLQGGTITTGATTPGVVGGFAAFGIVGQSIGSGGGLLADNSDVANGAVLAPDGVTLITSSIRVGATGSGPAAPGSGSEVTLSGNGTITTTGEAAHAIVLQSIGGGGGIGGAGTARFQPGNVGTSTISVFVGGGPNTHTEGWTVAVQNALLNVSTSGINAFGLLAQSIGGGGGLGFTQQGVPAFFAVGGQSAGVSDGGSVTVGLADGTRITTSGAGSFGIMAQSIGGGGGIGGYGAGAATIQRAGQQAGIGSAPIGNGGSVNISTGNSTIITTGPSAHGIVAQSVGGGGGMISLGGSVVQLGTTAYGPDTSTAGNITISQSGTLSATGTNAFGIVAQTASPNMTPAGNITITINGSVTGGSGQGAGLWIDSSGNGSSVTIGPTGSVSAASGKAATSVGNPVAVTNQGTVTGDVAGIASFANSGLWTPAVASSADVTNSGRIVLSSFTRPTLTGRLTQTTSGTLVVAADFNNRRAGSLAVQGDAVLAGTVTPVITSVLPNIAIPVLAVSGTISGGLGGASSALFGYGVARSGNQLLLSATSANFAPASFGLPDSRAAAAGHLQDAWNQGGNPALGTLFAVLGNTAQVSPSAYSAQLRQISPDAATAPGARSTTDTLSFATNAMSCPTFEGTTAMLVETQCAWLRVTGRSTGQDPGNGITSYRLGQVTTQLGGQKELGDGWLLGGSLAYSSSRLSSADSLTSGNGQAGYGAVTVKYQTGPWLLAAAAYGGAGQFNTSRVITIPGFTGIAKGNPDTASVGTLFRVNYTVGTEQIYVRPNVTVGVVNARTGAYRESGAGILNLGIDSSSRTTAVLSPMLEVGGRVELQDGMLMRPFVSAGVALFSNGSWRQSGRLISAPAGTGAFATSVPTDQVAARVGAGIQVSSGPFDLRLQYDGEFSKTVASNAGSLIGAWRF